MFLGLIIVLVSGALIFNYFQKRAGDVSLDGLSVANNEIPTPTYIDVGSSIITLVPTEKKEISEKVEEKVEVVLSDETFEYEVKRGDNLWRIAEKQYGDGFMWKKIAAENGVKGTMIDVGQKLKLHSVEGKGATIGYMGSDRIDGTEYTVAKGDSLSKIALRAYGDYASWTKIYEANKDKIMSPNLIFGGTKLVIPR